MKFSVKALSLASGIFWALTMLFMGIANFIQPEYGTVFLQTMASIYPGYHANHTAASIVIGTLYAFFDGILFGLIFGWLYNLIAPGVQKS